MSLLEHRPGCDPVSIPEICLSLLDSLSFPSQDTQVAGGASDGVAAPGGAGGEMNNYFYKQEFDLESAYGARVGHSLLPSS